MRGVAAQNKRTQRACANKSRAWCYYKSAFYSSRSQSAPRRAALVRHGAAQRAAPRHLPQGEGFAPVTSVRPSYKNVPRPAAHLNISPFWGEIFHTRKARISPCRRHDFTRGFAADFTAALRAAYPPSADVGALHGAEKLISQAVVALVALKAFQKQLYVLPLRVLVRGAAALLYGEALPAGNTEGLYRRPVTAFTPNFDSKAKSVLCGGAASAPSEEGAVKPFSF